MEITKELLDKLVSKASEVIIEPDNTVRFIFDKVDKENSPENKIGYVATVNNDSFGIIKKDKKSEFDYEILNNLTKEQLAEAIMNRDDIINNIESNLSGYINKWISYIRANAISANTDSELRHELNYIGNELGNYNFKEWKGITK